MQQIKTIMRFVSRPSNADDFDCEVNEAIKDGWILENRKFIPMKAPDNHVLIAIMYRFE